MPKERPVFIAEDQSGNRQYVRPATLDNPRELYPFSKFREGMPHLEPWRGCNHCGRYVPEDCQRVEWRGLPDQPVTYMHNYCFMKLHQRSYAEVGSSRVDLQACKLEYSIVSPK